MIKKLEDRPSMTRDQVMALCALPYNQYIAQISSLDEYECGVLLEYEQRPSVAQRLNARIRSVRAQYVKAEILLNAANDYIRNGKPETFSKIAKKHGVWRSKLREKVFELSGVMVHDPLKVIDVDFTKNKKLYQLPWNVPISVQKWWFDVGILLDTELGVN